MLESIGENMALKHSRDRSLGDLYKVIPEYNLRDMTPTPEHFLSIFELQASTSVYNHHYEGAKALAEVLETVRPSRDLSGIHTHLAKTRPSSLKASIMASISH